MFRTPLEIGMHQYVVLFPGRGRGGKRTPKRWRHTLFHNNWKPQNACWRLSLVDALDCLSSQACACEGGRHRDNAARIFAVCAPIVALERTCIPCGAVASHFASQQKNGIHKRAQLFHRLVAPLGIAHCFTKKWNPQKVSWTFSVHYVYFFGSVRLTLFPCYGNLEPEMMEYSALIHRGTSGNVVLVGVIVHCLCKSKRNKYREGLYVYASRWSSTVCSTYIAGIQEYSTRDNASCNEYTCHNIYSLSSDVCRVMENNVLHNSSRCGRSLTGQSKRGCGVPSETASKKVVLQRCP